jgi:adenosylhomocysteine nucleosidase
VAENRVALTRAESSNATWRMQLGEIVIVVVGLAFEARIAAGVGTHVICSGDGRSLAALVARAIVKDCRGLISFGVAGGLSPGLPAGTCVVGSAILSGTARLMTDQNWSQTLLHAIPGAVYGMIVGASAPIAHPDAKRALHMNTGAVAVDMESHIVAGVAAAHGLPVAALRAITDPAARELPPVALAAMRPNGTADIAAMIRSVTKHPRELPALMRTALDAAAARATLLRGRQLLGPSFGLADYTQPELHLI